MFLTENKLQARLQELNDLRYRDRIGIPVFHSQVNEGKEIAPELPEGGEWTELRVGEKWKGRDLYLWMKASLDVPAEWSGRKVLGRFDFGSTGGGNNSGFESLFYFEGKPYQGVDSNHQEVFFPERVSGNKLDLTFRLWSGLEGGGQPQEQEHDIRRAELCWLDEAADDLFYTAWAALDISQVLEEGRPEKPLLLKAVNDAFRLIDWAAPGSDEFYASVAEARDTLHAQIDRIEKASPVTVQCIGHTHIDVAWLWRLKHTREKCARSFSTVLRLMEQFPDYVFLQTQPQLYDYVKSDYPELYEGIKARVKEGRWEAQGGMWLEADCNLTSGESLVRQLLVGTRFYRDEFGQECDYLWLPDVFGYSWALPQILRKSGIRTFMTTKISWNQYNRIPHDTFKWRGIDGSEVLTHFITTPEPWSQPGSWFYTYNGHIIPKTVKGIWDGYRNKELNQDLLLSYGYGDGGGGVNRSMLEMRRRLDKMPGMPKVETGTAGSFFNKLHETVDNTNEYVHTWDGELYLEYHRGTYTSQAYNKRMNRKLELMYREAEWLNALDSLRYGWDRYRHGELNDGWKIILRNQFHDIIPGSSIHEVYEDSTAEYAEAWQLGEGVLNESVQKLLPADGTGTFTVWNGSPWTATHWVSIDVAASGAAGAWLDAAGSTLQAQRTDGGWIVEVKDVPSMGFTTIRFRAEEAPAAADVSGSPFVVSASGVDTPFYTLAWNGNGQLTSIYDKQAEREVLTAGARGNVLQVFEDKPLAHEAWDIDLFYQEKMREVTTLESVETMENGELRAVVRFTWTYMKATIEQDMIVYAHNRRIDFKTEADWRNPKQLLKVAFPVDVRATEATYDIQFGNVKRPTHWNTSWDWARFETVGHQWADLSDRGYGVSLMNDCKYGYDIKDNVIRLSLIKCATHPDPTADQGHHAFTYSLLPHTGDWYAGHTVQEAWMLNSPLRCTAGRAEQDEFSMFRIDAPNVMIDAVKKAEDSEQVVLRVHDFSGSRSNVRVTSDLHIKSWQECDLMERPQGDVLEDEFAFTLKPYEIRTFLITLA